MDVRVGLSRKLSTEELMLLNWGVGEDSWESLGLQGDPTSPFWRDQPWDFFRRNDAKAETPILWPPHVKSWLIRKDSDAGRELGAGEGDARGWDGWMASPTQWTWVWVDSTCWWWTGRPGVLRFMGLQRIRHDWATELNWMTDWLIKDSRLSLASFDYNELLGFITLTTIFVSFWIKSLRNRNVKWCV